MQTMASDATMADEQAQRQAKLIGRAVRDRRTDRGWNQSDLARKAGVRPSYVNRLEAGGYLRPSANHLTKIAEALGCRLADLTDPVPADIEPGIEAELRAMFRPDEAPLVAEILRGWARHDGPTRRFLLRTMKPLVFELPDRDEP